MAPTACTAPTMRWDFGCPLAEYCNRVCWPRTLPEFGATTRALLGRRLPSGACEGLLGSLWVTPAKGRRWLGDCVVGRTWPNCWEISADDENDHGTLCRGGIPAWRRHRAGRGASILSSERCS